MSLYKENAVTGSAAEAEARSYIERDARLGNELVGILAEHVAETGESEGAVEVLQRLLKEHDCPRRSA